MKPEPVEAHHNPAFDRWLLSLPKGLGFITINAPIIDRSSLHLTHSTCK